MPLIPAQTGIHATEWPRHAQWARPAGHGLSAAKAVKPAYFLTHTKQKEIWPFKHVL